MSQEFKKVLVANRGEIAMRIFRACHDLGLQTIAIYSNEDMYSIFRTAADESYLIGENESPLGAYLDIPRIIELAKKHGADAIHPGYGFLSENADFARACEAAGIKFIGPPSRILELMGDKLSAKQIAVACGVPTTPGTTEPLKSREDAQKLAMEFGFPVILKAAAGGGGRGMRRCDTVEEVGVNFDLVKAEAKKALGVDDGRPLLVSFWGSLGASGMNRLMADFLALEAAKEPFHHIHGAGKSGCPVLLDLLREKGVDLKDHPALQVREYIYDMAPVMRAADLVLCRAGASTISELTALGVPALIVPSPYVTNNHQEKNARVLEAAGGAVVLLEPDCSGQALFRAASGILHDQERRTAMENAMSALGIRDATERIYQTVLEICR